jgi:hypothetical protein
MKRIIAGRTYNTNTATLIGQAQWPDQATGALPVAVGGRCFQPGVPGAGARPLADAGRVASKLDRIAEWHGLPLMIVSDNGTELTGARS